MMTFTKATLARLCLCLLLANTSVMRGVESEATKDSPTPVQDFAGIRPLPSSIKYEAGKISLVPDFSKRDSDGYISVYLINASEYPIENALDGLNPFCEQEVKIGDTWYELYQVKALDCGTVGPPSTLEAGKFDISMGSFNPNGDASGELRYTQTVRGRRFVSAPFKGHYKSEELLKSHCFLGKAAAGILSTLDPAITDGVYTPYSNICSMKNPEECLATAELDRCSGIFEGTMLALKKWQEVPVTNSVTRRNHQGIKELLAREWVRGTDGNRLFTRCVKALECRDPAKAPFGSPERNRALIFRYLNEEQSARLISLYQSRREEEFSTEYKLPVTPRAMARKWGIRDEYLIPLIIEQAIISLRSTNKEEATAACEYLSKIDIPEDWLPESKCWEMMKSDAGKVRMFTIQHLARNGKKEELITWLAKHEEIPGPELLGFWGLACDYREAITDSEAPIARECLKKLPYQTMNYISLRMPDEPVSGLRADSMLLRKLPDALHEPLRNFLLQQTDWDHLKIQQGDSFEPHVLIHALRMISSINDPADDDLLLRYLECPWKREGYRGGDTIETYELRMEASFALRARNHPIPEGIIFEKRIPKAEVPAGE